MIYHQHIHLFASWGLAGCWKDRVCEWLLLELHLIIRIIFILIVPLIKQMIDRIAPPVHRKPTVQYFDNASEKGHDEKDDRQEDVAAKEAWGCFKDASLEKGAQMPSYFSFIVLVGATMAILCLVFTLPLCLIIRSNSTATPQTSFLLTLSTFSIGSSASVQLLAYLAVPFFAVYLVLLALLTFKLQDIQKIINQANIFPDRHALLLQLPNATLSQQKIAAQVDAWFKKEVKFNKHFPEIFPELCQEESQVQSQMGSSLGKGKVQSRVLEGVLLSYNYEQYVKISQEVQGMGAYLKEDGSELKAADIQALINLYNKQKNILSLLPLNPYALLLFKQAAHAQYFHQKTTGSALASFFCIEKYSDFQIGRERVGVTEGLLPNEIYWKHLHETSNASRIILSLLLWILLASLVVGFQFASIYLRWNNLINHANEGLYIFLSSLLVNILILVCNKIMVACNCKQLFLHYAQKKKAGILQLWTYNLLCLCIAPLGISYLIFPTLLTDSSGFAPSQYSTLLIYMVFSMLDILITAFCMRSNQVEQEQQNTRFQSLLGSFLTVISITFCLAPMYPLIPALACLWFGAIYLLERAVVTRLLGEGECHSGKVMVWMVKCHRRCFICFIIGLITVYSFASTQCSNSWPLSTIIIISTILFLYLIFQMMGLEVFQSIRSYCSNEQSQLKASLIHSNYTKNQTSFAMLYEQFNFALSNNHANPQGYSTRLKIYEQLNTMSKTLSLSLKEKLFSNISPILNNEKRVRAEEEDVNDMYFEYEKKVTMKKAQPKVVIPPLFRKEESVERPEGHPEQVEMMNFNSIFSSDDKQGKQMLKKHIQKKLCYNAVQK